MGINKINVNHPKTCSIWIKFEISNPSIKNHQAGRYDKFNENQDYHTKSSDIIAKESNMNFVFDKKFFMPKLIPHWFLIQ